MVLPSASSRQHIILRKSLLAAHRGTGGKKWIPPAASRCELFVAHVVRFFPEYPPG